jgi:hypothetical protein
VKSGSDVIDFLPRLVRSIGGIKKCLFYRLPMPPKVEDRGERLESVRLISDLARGQRRRGESFIEVFLNVAAEKGAASDVLDAAMFHQSFDAATSVSWIECHDVTPERLAELCGGTRPREMLVFSSRVITSNGQYMHVPMMDFKVPKSPSNLEVAHAVGARLGGGWILDSGSSYHLYGRGLLTELEFSQWLLRGQLLNRYTDGRWITHQLMEGSAALRISERPDGRRPRVA